MAAVAAEAVVVAAAVVDGVGEEVEAAAEEAAAEEAAGEVEVAHHVVDAGRGVVGNSVLSADCLVKGMSAVTSL